ncbi:DUF1439 domain-containing protein [Shewanella glacialimarina]|jgi:hypothetical protein|uniref:DUF1439 domain-containing protein n=1 Tax=Shewanella glacialimarina TaxID=2590884 RepID=UPI001CF9249C|nr:DUF1439 domain-containing protein [Shewanella glacialimarina]UCX06319.1 DUF1439 domain-containing protein [Shewanella glacialimarina]
MKTLKLIFISSLLVLTGCASQYSITENEIENYLNKEMHFEVKQGNQIIGINLVLNDMQVSLGDKPNTMGLTATTLVRIRNPLMPISAKLKTTFEAQPWYNSETKSIYLRNLDLVNVSADPADLEQALTAITPQVMSFLRGFLESQPVYTLDMNDSNQALMAKMTKELAVQKGKLVVKF